MTLRTLSVLTLSLAALAGCAHDGSSAVHNGVADANGTNVYSAKQCQACADHGVGGAQAFEWFKGLANKDGTECRWQCHKADEKGQPQTLALTYKVVSNGSAVRETLFPGTPEEMVTMYHMDNGRLTATHYCAMGNQPRMQAAVCACDPRKKTCDFNFLDGTNMDASKDNFMGNQDVTFINADTMVIAWHHLGPGGVDKSPTFGGEFRRVK